MNSVGVIQKPFETNPSIFMNRTNKKLAQQVATRQAFIEKAIAFVEDVVPQLGRQTHYHQGSYNTNQTFMLEDWHGFSIEFDRNQTYLGGNTIKIWFSCGDTSPGTGPGLLSLIVYWQINPKEVELKFFDDHRAPWQSKLRSLMRRKKTLLAQAEGQKKRQVLRSERDEERQKAGHQLKNQARRLLLVPA